MLRPAAHLSTSAARHCGGSQPTSPMASRTAATPTSLRSSAATAGDDPRWEYQDTPARLQRLRGPYGLMAGTAKYVAHIQWHEKLIHARR